MMRLLQIRFNELEIGVIVFKSAGSPSEVVKYCDFLQKNKGHWLVREILSIGQEF
ncbi:MAG: hypothetical protein CM15mP62_28510 [Rhodospirillaceae bacterium]|nr:MAG: hypothetical protein CM15mP62_28510 [Rhodospirillaceae bacterium]